MMIKVLIAEDELPLLRGIKFMIEQTNPHFTVVKTALNGIEAQEYLQEHPVDVVFTDINMPLMNGIELMKFIHENHPHILRVAISGYDDFTYAQQAIHYQVSRYLLKPVVRKDMEELLTFIHQTFLEQKKKEEKDQLLQALYPVLEHHLKDNSFLKKDSTDALIPKVELYIREHLTEPLSVKELAAEFGLAPPYLGKLFKELTGYSPGQYIQMLRIEYAKALLTVHEDLLAKDVAFMVGYTDSAYFSRVFKQKVGVWPSEYKKG